jgi:membrane protease YdiL (CAAX protease family)
LNPDAPLELAQEALRIPTAADASAGLLVVVLCAITAPLCIAIARRIFPGRNVVFARWGFSHVAAAFAIGLAALLVTSLVPRPDDEPVADPVANLCAGVFVTGLVAAYVARTAEAVEPAGERALGLSAGRVGRAIGVGLFAYVWFVPAILGLYSLWPWLLDRLGEDVEAQDLQRLLPELAGWRLAAFVILAAAVVPLLEEIVFRSFLQPLLVQNLNEPAGVGLTSFVFAALHGTSAFLPIFALSLLLGAVMLRTQRLAAVWAVHALHNGLTLSYVLATT